MGRWVRAGCAARLAGRLKLSERRRDEESKAGAAVWGKVWHFFYMRRLVLKRAVQGRWQGIQGLPLQPAASQGLELMATGAECGGPAAFWHSRADLVQRPSRESEVCGESLISQEAMLVKPGARLSTLYLEDSACCSRVSPN